MKRSIVIGSRGSDLALWQANSVKRGLETFHPAFVFDVKIIRTTGDQLQDVALSKIGDKGLFTRQIETELLNGNIDFAVHSLKDLQTEQPEGLIIGAVCEREIPNDVLVSRQYTSIAELPRGASVATGSLRRRSQLLHHRPDLTIVEIRGNVPTRLEKFLNSDLDAMVLAYAGLERLGLGRGFSHVIPTDIMLPAVGQGAIAVEVRTGDNSAMDMASRINDEPTKACVTAERACLRRLEGGCQVPIGALAVLDGGSVKLDGIVGSLDGRLVFRGWDAGEARDAAQIGTRLAESLIERGADKLLDQARDKAANKAEAVL